MDSGGEGYGSVRGRAIEVRRLTPNRGIECEKRRFLPGERHNQKKSSKRKRLRNLVFLTCRDTFYKMTVACRGAFEV